MAAEGVSKRLASSGVPGLDEILIGGLERENLYLIEGTPGSGKTTMAMQFLIEGARHGERTLYITLSESEQELRKTAASHRWSLDGVTILQVTPLRRIPTSSRAFCIHRRWSSTTPSN